MAVLNGTQRIDPHLHARRSRCALTDIVDAIAAQLERTGWCERFGTDASDRGLL